MHNLKKNKVHQLKTLMGLTALSVLSGISSATTQEDERLSCGIEHAHEALYKKHPEIKAQYEAYEAQLELNKMLSINTQSAVAANYTIPVVFHIVHAGGVENITDAQIQESINQLNEDYNGNDPRKDLIFDEFKARYANIGMRFVLARLDPDGNPTDGITRHYSPDEVTQFNDASDGMMKAKYAWPREKYLNIYVVRSAGGQSGSAWAFYPSQVNEDKTKALDGVISSHWAIGRSGTATPTHWKILTHEIGHWANLAHTFQNGCSAPGDSVSDTPPTQTGSGCDKVWTPCSGGGIANTQNYMDYGTCTSMFTTGQSDRMTSAMNSTVAGRNNLFTQANLQATGVTGMPVSALFNIEKNQLAPGGRVKFNDVSEAESGTISSWEWSFPGGTPSSYNGQTPPSVVYNTPGTYSATLKVSNGSSTNTVTKNDYITVSKDIVMRNDVVRSCSAKFYDSGNNHAGNAGAYGNREDHKLVLLPNKTNSAVKVNFNEFILENNSNCDLDSLKIYDGLDENSTLIGSYCGNTSPGSISASNSAGALTFVFHSNVKARTKGWDADVSCVSGQGGGNISPMANANGPYNIKATQNQKFSSANSVDLDGEITQYAWNFGDGKSSNDANPTHSYSSIGAYNASLTVTDNSGASSTQNFVVSVRANQPDPIVVEANGPYTAKEGQGIDFSSAGTSDLDNEITKYQWDFGDGTTKEFHSPTHTYQLAGSYTATLTVTNDAGETAKDTAEVTINIEPGDPPPAMVDACASGSPKVTEGEIKAGAPVCTGKDTDDTISFSIANANSYRSIAITTAHGEGDISLYFKKNGWPTDSDYSAKSTNTGNNECIYLRNLPDYWNYIALKGVSGQGGTTIAVDFNTSGCRSNGQNVDPLANINAPTAGDVGTAVAFDGSSSSDSDGSVVSYSWNFGDNSGTASGAKVNHTFTKAGTYNVSLTVTDNQGATNTTSHSINIKAATNQAPTAKANGPYVVNLGDTVVFNSNGSTDPEGEALAYAWNFGDSNTGTGPSPGHKYASTGDYTVTLTVTDVGGLTDTATATVTVKDATPIGYCTSSGGGTYEWISNVEVNGFTNPSDGATPYTDFTSLTVNLNNGDNAIALTTGGSYTEHWKIWIDFNQDGDFEDANEVVLSNLSGKNTVNGNINIPANTNVTTRMRIAMKYNGEAASPCGDFGDGETEDYTVKITGTGTGENKPPVAKANGPYSAKVGQSITFDSTGSADSDGSIASYAWTFGDNNTGTGATPSHTYTAAGNYTVNLTVTDDKGATGSSTANVTITEEPTIGYCAANGGGGYEWIANVESNGFSNPTGDGDYSDFTAQTINLVSGSNAIKLTPGGSYTEHWKIWIDYNQDGDFTDAGETVLTGLSAKGVANGTINVPANTNITTRMRIAMKYNGEASSSCGDIGDGEVEDYTVSITSSTTSGGDPVGCGATTNDGGGLIYDQAECVNKDTAGRYSYYVNVAEDNTKLYFTTSDGKGDVDIYYNADTWATNTDYQYKSDLVGNNQTLQVSANKGYRYVTLSTDSEFSDVNFVVSTTPPKGNEGQDSGNGGVGGSGTTDPNDPDCQLADTPTNDPKINMYTFTNDVNENYYEGWVRVRGTSVSADYQLKYCAPTYGNIRLGDRSEIIDANHYGKEFEYSYKHWGARDTNTDTIKAIATATDGSKAVFSFDLTLNNPTVEHPVQPSCDNLMLDADFDGIPDCAEEPGKTFYTMPLYDWGARKNQIDLFIEVDWMDKHPLKDYDGNYVYDENGNQIIDHGTEPKRKVLDRVKEVFAARDIHIHFDIGDKFDQAPGLDPNDYDLGGGQAIPFMEYIHLARWTDNYNGKEIKVPGMDEDVMPQYFFNNKEREHIFYYVLFANSQGGANRGSSGQAPDLFDRFMYLSMGGTGWQFTDDTPENENMMINGHASTMVHELGHIFGLSHDGFPDDRARNFKLNYPSAMNYLFQLQGGPTDKFTDIDYDTMVRERYYLWQNPKLDYACNARLDETHPDNKTWGNLVHGLSSDPADFHIGFSDGLQPKIDETEISEGLLSAGLDLNCDGNIDNNVGPLDVNHDEQIDFLWDYDDWGYLTFFYHYYNYDVKNEYDTYNEFLLEPNYHVRWGRSPTDVKYPNLKTITGLEKAQTKENSLLLTSKNKDSDRFISLKERQAKSDELIGVKEMILPQSARDALHKAMDESRRKAFNKQRAENNK
ncbi:PKD domain-containing protein [Aliikangiella sp. IMCC44359]|uniref:PKD domain-containing protein n=1 Tax=Aliikangiella sp. IMCC44359 TaxID=3459125 RepID=UPI00403B1CFE